MPGTSPLLAISYPVATDAASPAGVQTSIQQLEKYLVGVFASTTARDTAWTAAGGAQAGALAYITGTGELQLRTGSAWVVIGGRPAPYAVAAGTAAYALNAVSSITVTITFPSGRFSLAPIVFAGNQSAGGGTQALTFRPFTVTAASCSLAISHNAGTVTTVTGETYAWTALQMSAGASAG
jgi:hypothetical protein